MVDSGEEKGEKKYRFVRKEKWVENWEADFIPFHLVEFSSYLDLDLEGGGGEIRVFLPLCGKSLDILWLHQRNRNIKIVGVEASAKACRDFFTENGIAFKSVTEDVAGGFKVEKFVSSEDDGRIVLICADLFELSAEYLGKFHVIWDRGSLCAIDKTHHDQYAKLMSSVMSERCRYLLEVVEYDEVIFGGPPHSTPLPLLHRLYGGRELELLKEGAISNEDTLSWGFSQGLPCKVYFIH